jgi:hypothetical protein
LDLFFPTPVTTIDRRTNKKKVIPHWKKTSIFSYSLNFLKQKQKNSTFYFLQCFKLYRIISTSIERQQKIELIQLFLKWLKLKNNSSSFKSDLKEENVFYLLEYFNLLIRLLIKYEIFQKIWVSNKIETKTVIDTEKKWLQNIIQTTNSSSLQNLFQLSTDQTLKLLDIYDKSIGKSQKAAHIQLNRKLILITNDSKEWLSEMRNFYFLKQSINQLTQKVKEINQGIEFKELRPTIYFSTSLKEQLKYIFGKNKLLYKPDRHKYIKTKTQLLLYKEDHEIKTNYHKKYDEKDLYTAILIPEYGSWIRFGFQKNTKINPYKYPLKNQEEEITIQLDKVNQKPVLYLLKEMGLSDLEIYRNLEHSDFFYFNKPLIISLSFQEFLIRPIIG